MTQQKPDSQTRRQHLQRVGGVAMTAIGGTTLATNSASASSSPEGILGDGISAEGGDLWSFISGRLSMVPVGIPDTVESVADDIRNEFRANTDLWIDYGNWVLEDTDFTPSDHTVVGVDVTITRGRYPPRETGTVETTVEATYDSATDEFTGLEWLEGGPDDPDYEVELKNMAAEHAADELQTFRREFIDTSGGDDHEYPDSEYVSKLAGRYSGSVTVEGDSVLELLLGEVDDVF